MRIIFTDENSFETGLRNRIFVISRLNERYYFDYCQNFKYFERQFFMI